MHLTLKAFFTLQMQAVHDLPSTLHQCRRLDIMNLKHLKQLGCCESLHKKVSSTWLCSCIRILYACCKYSHNWNGCNLIAHRAAVPVHTVHVHCKCTQCIPVSAGLCKPMQLPFAPPPQSALAKDLSALAHAYTVLGWCSLLSSISAQNGCSGHCTLCDEYTTTTNTALKGNTVNAITQNDTSTSAKHYVEPQTGHPKIICLCWASGCVVLHCAQEASQLWLWTSQEVRVA